MGGWTHVDQTFVLHNAPIADGSDEIITDDREEAALVVDSEPESCIATACVFLVTAPIVPLLPAVLAPPPPDPDPPYAVVRDAGWKGAGLFAARDIPAGARILVDRPLAIVPADLPIREPFDALLTRLTPNARKRLTALANCKALADHPEAEGIALTNAIRVELPGPPGEYGAVLPRVPRANHRCVAWHHSLSPALTPASCALHASVVFDLPSLSASMYALRPFAAGEEITHSYVDVLGPRAARQAALSARYAFRCDCPACALPPAAAAKSDAARAALRAWSALRLRLGAWAADPCRADDALHASHAEALALAESEALHGLRVPLIEDCARASALLGDYPAFCAHAQEVVRLCAVMDPERAARFTQWMRDPTTFAEPEGRWGQRKKQREELERNREIDDMSIPW
ncbi:hypothetical protein B0H15DRAFT_547034 [Mycena belliarum]|uniref:SET domain-containing protein n=1 Tax=Mycena belliarum TaxID=1033014 RepID=A0AAD6XVR2_9AGAR|nr:hypothetical protein B0H15DRAFT_547034 [Mycena belliae]